MIPASPLFDQTTIATLLDHDPIVQEYRAFFSLLDWSVVERWQAQRSGRRRPAHPESAYLKAFIIRIREGLIYASQLRRYLLTHPLLVIELGFHLMLDPTSPYGFNPEQTLRMSSFGFAKNCVASILIYLRTFCMQLCATWQKRSQAWEK